MSDTSRRGFLSIAGVGAAAGVAVAVAPSAIAAEDASLPKEASGSMAAYIHDVHKGEVMVLTEGREVVVKDKVLVARLVRAFHRAEQG